MSVKAPTGARLRGRVLLNRAIKFARAHRNDEPLVIVIACGGCERDLAEVPPEVEAYCPACGRWTRVLEMSKGASPR